MSATGTVTLTRNSTSVTGSGTAFSSDLAVGGFIVATVGGSAYTLGIKSIESDTALTLQIAYKGPTTSAVAFDYVPFATLNLITSALAAQVNEALRANNLDRDNWQQIFTGTGNVTITLPDGTMWTGPAWNSITTEVDKKAKKGANNDITSLSALSTALSIEQGGTGAKTKADAWKNLAIFGNTTGTAAEGTDSRLNTLEGKTGGAVISDVQIRVLNSFQSGGTTVNQSGRMQLQMPNGNQPDVGEFMTERIVGGAASLVIHHKTDFSDNYWKYGTNGAVNSPGPWNVTSDERHKTEIEKVKDPLSAILSWRGCTFYKKDFGKDVGLIAQDVEKWCPDAVSNGGQRKFFDGSKIDDLKVLNITGVSAAYHTEAIKSLFYLVELVLTDPETAIKHIDQIKEKIL